MPGLCCAVLCCAVLCCAVLQHTMLLLLSCMQNLLDLAGIYRTWNSKYNSWSVFGQDHVAKLLLKYDVSGSHDAVGDAIKSIRLFKLSQQLQQTPDDWEQAKVWLIKSSAKCDMQQIHIRHAANIQRMWQVSFKVWLGT